MNGKTENLRRENRTEIWIQTCIPASTVALTVMNICTTHCAKASTLWFCFQFFTTRSEYQQQQFMFATDHFIITDLVLQ